MLWGLTLATLLVAPHLTGSWVFLASVWTVIALVRLFVSRLKMAVWKRIVLGVAITLALLYLWAFWYVNTYGTY